MTTEQDSWAQKYSHGCPQNHTDILLTSSDPFALQSCVQNNDSRLSEKFAEITCSRSLTQTAVLYSCISYVIVHSYEPSRITVSKYGE